MLEADSMDITRTSGAVDVKPRSRSIRGVIFDIDGTLYRQRPVRRRMALRLGARYWRAPMAGATTLRVLAAYREAQEVLRQHGSIGDIAQAQIDLAAERTGIPAACVGAVVDEWMNTRPLDLVRSNIRTGLVATLDALRDRGLLLGVVSDYPAAAKLAALGISDRFDTVISADDPRVQAFKPDPRGLTVGLDDLRLQPGEAMYVGDRPDVDAAAATAVGMSWVLIGDRARSTEGGAWISHVAQLIALVDQS
jgi:HAD superfamily hydrolase (TIGR01509 family)